MHKSVGTFIQEARKKGKPIIANPKARIADEDKKRPKPKPYQMKAWKHKCAKAKLIVPKRKAKKLLT
jgi:hypothetical protein